MKEFLILISFCICIETYAFCRTDKPKNLSIKKIHDESFSTFSNGKYRIISDDHNFKILDFYTDKGFPYEGVNIYETSYVEPDHRMKILKILFPKEPKYSKTIEIDLSDEAILNIQGINDISLNFVFLYKSLKIKTTLSFGTDISDNCRAK